MRRLRSVAAISLFSVAFISVRAIAAPPSPPSGSPLGMVVAATNSRTGVDASYEGLTVYDGDRLATQEDGTMRLRLATSQLLLFHASAVKVHALPGGFSADIENGIVSASSSEGQTFQLVVNGIAVRPASSHATVAQVQWVSQTEATLITVRGDLKITLGDETKTAAAGNSYKVEIASPDNSSSTQQTSQPAGKNRNRLLVILIAGVAATSGVAVWRALVSPTAP